ncbi:MAG: molybdopterin-dependent oxidoreductase, partial [Candidatus Erginobacter occultus]|nr:molybdopterin-dependent oxidoreductase [Candidatus Erginobacter occultus]
MKKQKFNQVNTGVEKVDGLGLALGQGRFTDDYSFPGMLHGKLLRSPHAHARIKKIETKKAEALPGVAAVFTHQDVPRIAITTAGQGFPEPSPYDEFILDNKVRFVGDKVALVAAETAEIAEEALKLIEVEYEVLPAVLDPRKSMRSSSPVIHDEKDCEIVIPVPYEPEKNRVARVDAVVGDIKRGVAEAEMTVEDEFENQTASHSAMEPHCSISRLDENGRLEIIST